MRMVIPRLAGTGVFATDMAVSYLLVPACDLVCLLRRSVLISATVAPIFRQAVYHQHCADGFGIIDSSYVARSTK